MKGRLVRTALVLAATLAWAAAASAGDLIEGEDILIGKDSRHNTVHIGAREFTVTPQTILRDEAGTRLSFAQLAVPELSAGSPGLMMARWKGIYTARKEGGKRVLVSLDIESFTE